MNFVNPSDSQTSVIRLISGVKSPTAILSITLPENRSIFCGTTLTMLQNLIQTGTLIPVKVVQNS